MELIILLLGKHVNLPDDLLNKCEQLSRVYIETRYGALGGHIPSEKFNESNTPLFIKICEEILKWVERNI